MFNLLAIVRPSTGCKNILCTCLTYLQLSALALVLRGGCCSRPPIVLFPLSILNTIFKNVWFDIYNTDIMPLAMPRSSINIIICIINVKKGHHVSGRAVHTCQI